jgi:hypothetical protein
MVLPCQWSHVLAFMSISHIGTMAVHLQPAHACRRDSVHHAAMNKQVSTEARGSVPCPKSYQLSQKAVLQLSRSLHNVQAAMFFV